MRFNVQGAQKLVMRLRAQEKSLQRSVKIVAGPWVIFSTNACELELVVRILLVEVHVRQVLVQLQIDIGVFFQ